MLNIENFNASTTNWIGLWTLFSKETTRFLKVFYQTVLAPVVTNILFLTVFLIVIDRDNFVLGGVSYSEFLVPGLIMMQILISQLHCLWMTSYDPNHNRTYK